MKKFLTQSLTLLLVLSLLAGCSNPEAKYKKAVKDAELDSRIEELFDDMDDFEVPEQLSDMDMEVMAAEPMADALISSFKKDVDKFAKELGEVLDELEDIDGNDKAVKEEHDNLIEALEETKSAIDTISDGVDIISGIISEFSGMMELQEFFETDMNEAFMSLSTNYSMAFMMNADAVMGSMMVFETLDFDTLTSGNADLSILQDSLQGIDDSIALVESIETENEFDEQVSENLIAMFNALKSIMSYIADNADMFKDLGKLSELNDSFDDYKEAIEEWLEFVE